MSKNSTGSCSGGEPLNIPVKGFAPVAPQCCGGGIALNPASPVLHLGSAGKRIRYRIEQMDCPTEEALIRGKLEGMPGILGLEFNLVQRILKVHHQLDSTRLIEEAVAALGMRAEPLASVQTPVRIAQMDCPTEEKLIRDRLANMQGVDGLDFNLLKRVLTVTHAPEALEPILAAIRDLGFTPQAESAGTAEALPEPRKAARWPLALAGAAALGAEVLEFAELGQDWLVMGLALAAILCSGLATYKKGWIALKNLNLNINALMSIAVTGAVLIGHWPEAAMVMFLFALAERIEARSIDRARQAISGLMELAPEMATIRQNDGSWREVHVREVPRGAILRVRPGERIGLDGEVIAGRSTVNQAPITGESLPVEKTVGDTVFAGTINESGSFEYRVTAAAGHTTLARIIQAVEEAQGARAPTQRFVDQFAKVYTPAIFAMALVVAVFPPLLDGAWLDWVYRALVLLVVACPCALVISTPVTIVSGLAAAARQGILIKGGLYLETGRRLNLLALDKTGTLTQGKPEQTDFELLADMDEARVRRLAASLAGRSDHPVSQAIARAYQGPLDEVNDFAALLGRGTQGRIGGQMYHLGNYRLITELGLASPQLEAHLDRLERQGKTLVMLADESRVLALFAVADKVKEHSREAIAELHALGVKTLMLTGDNEHTAQAIAETVGIDQVQGNLLPQDKQRAIESASVQGLKVGMVGDGINDAPALARADIGFAMGAAGTDTAIETADVALMDDDLRKIPAFVRLSRKAARVLAQNIALAIGIKAVFLVLTLDGSATMWMAVFADMGTSLLVVANGLRVLNHPEKWGKRA